MHQGVVVIGADTGPRDEHPPTSTAPAAAAYFDRSRTRIPGLGPAWALGSVGNISFFPVLDDVKELTILAEAGDASSRAIKICGRRWHRKGRRVFRSRSPVGSDHNDILMQRVS